MTARELLRGLVDSLSEEDARKLLEFYQSDAFDEQEEFTEAEIEEILRARDEMRTEGGIPWDEVKDKLHL